MIFQIERNTRQWLGIVIIGGIIAAMIFMGLIPGAEYQKYIGFVVGAFFYHIIRMLNGPDHSEDVLDMVAPSTAATQELPK